LCGAALPAYRVPITLLSNSLCSMHSAPVCVGAQLGWARRRAWLGQLRGVRCAEVRFVSVYGAACGCGAWVPNAQGPQSWARGHARVAHRLDTSTLHRCCVTRVCHNADTLKRVVLVHPGQIW
jgi:hypothetical protein